MSKRRSITRRITRTTVRKALEVDQSTLRAHQRDALKIAEEIAEGSRDDKFICAHVTPGGGKSLMASLFAHELFANEDVDHWLYVGPRDSLRSQIRDAWTNEAVGLLGGLQITHGTQRALYAREQMGYATTFQHVVANEDEWLRIMSRDVWGIIIDEGHHLPDTASDNAEEARWTASMRKLVEKAKRVLTMTGSIARQDHLRIAFFKYDEKTRKPLPDILYTRRAALEAHAVLNVNVKLCDGDARYWHRFRHHAHALRTAPPAEQARALDALLEKVEYRNAVLSSAIEEWARYRDGHNARARMIVVTKDVKGARSVCKHIRATHKRWTPVLAVSTEKDAHRDLARFRDKREGDILVTCQMAYEGLDVPDCTHLVCLTNIRSRPWLEQAFSRVTRFDHACGHAWDAQCAYLFVPDDAGMVSFLAEWLDEQDGRFDPSVSDGGGSQPPPRPARSTFEPESGELTGFRFGDNLGVLSEPSQKRIILFDREFPPHEVVMLTTSTKLKIARKMWPDDNELDALVEADKAAE